MSPSADKPFLPSLAAAGIAASVNFPLWRASTMAHSGFQAPLLSFPLLPQPVTNTISLYKHAMTGPFPGLPAVVGGMTWARCVIFWGSDTLKTAFKESGISALSNPVVLNIVPAFTVSTFVQVVNMPIIRATITQQDPLFKRANGTSHTTTSALKHIYQTGGINALWHGTSAGLLKTVPKYMVSIVVKDAVGDRQKAMNEAMVASGQGEVTSQLLAQQSAVKSILAGVAGAVLTNPADVIRNEMFKCDNSTLMGTLRDLNKGGLRWMMRGVDKNLLAVAAPVAVTIFLTDVFEQHLKKDVVEAGGELKRRVTRLVKKD
jgi:hypothetical protein